jgi:hypothetical protein
MAIVVRGRKTTFTGEDAVKLNQLAETMGVTPEVAMNTALRELIARDKKLRKTKGKPEGFCDEMIRISGSKGRKK